MTGPSNPSKLVRISLELYNTLELLAPDGEFTKVQDVIRTLALEELERRPDLDTQLLMQLDKVINSTDSKVVRV